MSEEVESQDYEQEIPVEEVTTPIGDEADGVGSVPSFADVFKARGIPVPDGVDDDTLFQHTLGALQFRNKVSDTELAELYQYRARYQTEQKPAETKVDEPAKPAFATFPEGIEQYVQFDERSKRYVPTDERFPNLKAVEAANAFLDQRKKWEQKFYSNPIEFLDEVGFKDREARLREEIKKEILSEIQGQQVRQSTEAQMQQFWETHGKELIQVDAKGQYVFDMQGNPVLTRKGQAFDQAVQEAQAYGITDPLKLNQFAYKQVESAWKRQPKEKPAKAGDESAVEQEEEITPEQGKKAFIEKAKAEDAAGKQTVKSRVINRDATVATAARNREPQNAQQSFEKALREKFKAGGAL